MAHWLELNSPHSLLGTVFRMQMTNCYDNQVLCSVSPGLLESHVLKNEALRFLRTATENSQAEFREGQWAAIQSALAGKRSLVVQRTGWGKSMVYFIATRFLRNRGQGPTLLVSPLLALMRNQIEAAERIGLTATTINSTNTDEWEQIESDVKNGDVDILLISPERLGNTDFQKNVLQPIAGTIGMLVVDEAHCISDWGHDFRPDYRRIVRILNLLPPNIPVIATTATANNRVVDDIHDQLGEIDIQRGRLVRESLSLQNIKMPSPSARLAWLAQTIPSLPNSGIVYVLTQRDAGRVTSWLNANDISAATYHAGIDDRESLEQLLLSDRIKVLVATVALGMGFDKPDLGFVIHFQRPSSVVHYYQQVGRAGRALEDSHGVLLHGEEDDKIAEYFIATAFPPQYHVGKILELLQQNAGLSVAEIENRVNLKYGQIAKAIKFMSVESPSPVTKIKSKWYATPAAVGYRIDEEHVENVLSIRRAEQKEMQAYMLHDGCLMRFLANALDDPMNIDCGRCAHCDSSRRLDESIDQDLANRAAIFLRRSYQPIEPRGRWPQHALPEFGFRGNIKPELRAEEGRALCLWGDEGWGSLVRQGKYTLGEFDDKLVTACVDLLKTWSPLPAPTWVTCVPSKLHPSLVPNFAKRFANELGIPFVECISKIRDTAPQKEMQNSFRQANNLDGAFAVHADSVIEQPCLLLDDMIDSRWTMTVLAALLRQNGAGNVFPLALALNSPRMD